MVFASITFLFLFLPLCLSGYLLAPRRWKNHFLLGASLLFYFWGSQQYTLVMVASILLNFASGLVIAKLEAPLARRNAFIAAVAANLALLFYFKYFNFAAAVVNDLRGGFGLAPVGFTAVVLPIGISFFTFQAMSYVIDLYRGVVPVQKNLLTFALYKTLFPQLIAGPIVRYVDVADQLSQRVSSAALFSEGARRFILGLAKKVLIANTMAEVADEMFGLPAETLSTGACWLGVLAYAFQIYFDFSGYSDMAIGLGRMFGFTFLENFNYPYISRSLTEFWKRWHISLSTWFRDYLYIPLGGNRRSAGRTYLNLFIVFTLCGFWHGAAWTFLVWGFWHGGWLIIERLGLGEALKKAPALLSWGWTFALTLFGWVLFRAETLPHAGRFFAGLFGRNAAPTVYTAPYLTSEFLVTLMIAAVCASPLLVKFDNFTRKGCASPGAGFARWGAAGTFYIALFALSAMRLAASGYNPFIYFRF